MNTMVLTVPGMTCGHCEAAVKEEVGALAARPAIPPAITVSLVAKTSCPAKRLPTELMEPPSRPARATAESAESAPAVTVSELSRRPS